MSHTTKEIQNSINNVIKYIKKNNKRPQTIKVGSKTYTLAKYLNSALFLDARKRIKNFRDSKGMWPNYVTIQGIKVDKSIYKVLWNIQTKVDGNFPDTHTQNVTTNEVYNYFCKVFGKTPKTIDECLSLVKEHGYSHYYNDVYSNKEAIKRMKNYQGINCTDACHVFFNIAQALGYEVQCLHVKCSGGDGHVRLRLKHKTHTGGSWINRDPAAVISKNGQPLTYNWCISNYTLLATNPSWFMVDLKR